VPQVLGEWHLVLSQVQQLVLPVLQVRPEVQLLPELLHQVLPQQQLKPQLQGLPEILLNHGLQKYLHHLEFLLPELQLVPPPPSQCRRHTHPQRLELLVVMLKESAPHLCETCVTVCVTCV
jgi:hypothetical protein